MAAEVLKIANSVGVTVDDDEVLVLYASPASVQNGTSRNDAISVEEYNRKSKRVIDLSKEDDEVKFVCSFYEGECSNAKSADSAKKVSIPLTIMCGIFADEKPISDMFRILGCNHFLCSECSQKYVETKLQDNITAINCPYSGCKALLQPQHCRSILPKQVFDRWGDALCEALILGSEKFYFPFKDCSALLIDERTGANEVITESECPHCNRLFCAGCKVPRHLGIGSEDFQKLSKDERDNEDIMLMNLAKMKNWIRCPECRFYVEKSDGCLFMRCRCGHSFCYNCGAPLRDHYCAQCKR